MKEVVIISGKGGTGKTSMTAALASLATNIVVADCDVDGADLHLLLDGEKKRAKPFLGGNVAVIRNDDCTGCGKCLEVCRFDAITDDYHVKDVGCEGCGVCVHFCPVNAIDFPIADCGELIISDCAYGTLVHGHLTPGAENSGKLASFVREEAKAIGEEQGADYLLIDGPPGIGCPVIASITGVDLVVAVTEPSIAAKHDLERLISLCAHFKVPVTLVVNKWDINEDVTLEIESYVTSHGGTLAGRVAWSRDFTNAQMEGKPVTSLPESACAAEVAKVWKAVSGLIQEQIIAEGKKL